MLWSFRPLPDLWTITVKSSFRNGFAHRVNKSILHYWHNSYYVMLATVNQTWALAFHSLPAKSHNRYYKRSYSITTRDRPDSYSMAWKRSLQMCVSKHHVQFVLWPKVNINVVSFMSGVDLLTQMTVHGSSGLQSNSGRSHDDLYIVKTHCWLMYWSLVDILVKFICNHLADNHAMTVGRFIDMIHTLVFMTEHIRGQHAVQLSEV